MLEAFLPPRGTSGGNAGRAERATASRASEKAVRSGTDPGQGGMGVPAVLRRSQGS